MSYFDPDMIPNKPEPTTTGTLLKVALLILACCLIVVASIYGPEVWR